MRSIRFRLITVFTIVIIVVNLTLSIVALNMFSKRVTQSTFDELQTWPQLKQNMYKVCVKMKLTV